LSKFDIEAQHPDEFIHHQFGLNHAGVLVAAQRCRKRLKRPPITAEEYLNALEAQSLPQTPDVLGTMSTLSDPSHIRRPGFIEPCLPSPADHPPSGSNWIHEIKHDGYRLMARRDLVSIRLITRRGNEIASRSWSRL
jgi:ATP-dependent DNA ligase